jgi:hypothetical protein
MNPQTPILIGASMNEGYYPKAIPYFKTMTRALSSNLCSLFFVGIDFDPKYLLERHHLSSCCESYQVKSSQLHDPHNFIIQHGDFLVCDKKFQPEDYIIWLDCDAHFQRSLRSLDLQHFSENKVCVGILPNKGQENLRFEYKRLRGVGSVENTLEALGFSRELADKPTFNTGCVGMTYKNWCIMRDLYNEKAFSIKNYSDHYARQQFLMSLIIHTHFEYEIMPKYIHCDGHYNYPEFISLKERVFVYDDGMIKIPAFYCHGGNMTHYAPQ